MFDVPVHLGGFSLQPIMVQNKQLTEKGTKKMFMPLSIHGSISKFRSYFTDRCKSEKNHGDAVHFNLTDLQKQYPSRGNVILKVVYDEKQGGSARWR
jgi:translation elongation factor EF-1alpha